MKALAGIMGLIVLLGAAFGAEPNTPEYLYQKALNLETAKADYQGAIPIYETIVKEYESNVVFVVKALLQMGICYEKIGNSDKADECAGKFVSLLLHSPEISAAFEKDVEKAPYIKDFLHRHTSGIPPPADIYDVDNIRRNGTKELWQSMLNSTVIDVDFKEASFRQVIHTLQSKIAEAEISSKGKEGKGISRGVTVGVPLIIYSSATAVVLEDNQSTSKAAKVKKEACSFQEWDNLPKITLSLQNVSVADVLCRVTEMAGVKYHIKDAGVVFELSKFELSKKSELQDKVDNARAGDTIVVKAGEYAGWLTITKPLILRGETPDKVTITDGGEYGIKVMADDVTIENLSVRSCKYGILVRSHQGNWKNLAQTKNVRIRNVKVDNCIAGIYALKTANLTVENCTVADIDSDGIWVSWGAENTVIVGNRLKNIGDQGIWLGPYPNHPDTCAKNGFIVSNIVDTVRESGIFFAGENCEIKNNLICNVKGDGYSVGAISLRGNLVKNVAISRNIIRNNSSAGIGIKVDKKENCENIILGENNIYQNEKGGIANFTDVPVDARNNWWGAADGPRDADKNPQGIGNGISGRVLYDPWKKTQLHQPERSN